MKKKKKTAGQRGMEESIVKWRIEKIRTVAVMQDIMRRKLDRRYIGRQDRYVERQSRSRYLENSEIC